MTSEDLFHALDGLDAEFVMDAAPGKKLKRTWIRWAYLAACFCLLIAVFLFIPTLNRKDDGIDGGVLPTDIENIIWNEHIGLAGSTSLEKLKNWNGLTVDMPLYEVLQSCSSNEYIAIIMAKANGEIMSQSEYNNVFDETPIRDYKNNTLYIFATKEQVLNWEIDNEDNYVFYLANRSDYENNM